MADTNEPTGGPRSPASDSTLDLLEAARGGDGAALDRLFGRYVPELRRWAAGRLPRWARDLNDTHDLVQETVLRVFKKLEGFAYRGEGAFKAYLRQAVMNGIRNEIRRVRGRPMTEALDSALPDRGVSPIDAAVGIEALERYDGALTRLDPSERELIVARIELGLTYQEIADMAGKPSSDAARMAVSRALVRLSEEMGRA